MIDATRTPKLPERIHIDDGEQSMLWSQTENRRIKDPERQLRDAISELCVGDT